MPMTHRLLSFAATVILCLLLAIPCRSEEIVLAADMWCPYNCAPDTDRPGFMVEIAREVFAQHGIDVSYRVMPWSRAIAEARQGGVDGVIGAARPEVEDFSLPGVEQGMSTIIFLTDRKTDWRFTGTDSLVSIRLAVVQDYSYNPAMDEYIESHGEDEPHLHVSTGNTAFIQNLTLLDKGRVAAILIDRDVFSHFIHTSGKRNHYTVAGTLAADPVFIAFSPNLPRSGEYAAILTRGMHELRASGRLAEILARYGLSDWQNQ